MYIIRTRRTSYEKILYTPSLVISTPGLLVERVCLICLLVLSLMFCFTVTDSSRPLLGTDYQVNSHATLVSFGYWLVSS